MKVLCIFLLLAAVLLCCVSACGTVPENEIDQNAVYDTTINEDGEIKQPNDSGATTTIDNSALRIKSVDGVYYLNFKDGNESTGGNGGDFANTDMIGNVFYASLADMQRRFLEGNLTEGEVYRLKSTLALTDDGYEFFNVCSLYDVTLPDESWNVQYVSTFGKEYSVSFEKNDETINGNIRFISQDSFDLWYEHEFEKCTEETVSSEITEYQGVPCIAYEYDTRVATLRKIHIPLSTENGTIDIVLEFCLYHSDDADRVNLEVPTQISIYGNDERQPYIISLNMDTAPTPELLQSFSIVPFEP